MCCIVVFVTLCCVALRCVVLFCSVVLSWVVLTCVVLCNVDLCCVVLCCRACVVSYRVVSDLTPANLNVPRVNPNNPYPYPNQAGDAVPRVNQGVLEACLAGTFCNP